jgi:hypothetical protein
MANLPSGPPIPFRPITSAPTDEAVEVLHGKPQIVVLAEWDRNVHGWVKVGDPNRRVLRRVVGWRSISPKGAKP